MHTKQTIHEAIESKQLIPVKVDDVKDLIYDSTA